MLPKAKAERPDVLVIMIAAYGDAETKRKALENNAEALLTKQSTSCHSAVKSIRGRTGRMKAARLRRPRAETEISLSADDREEE